MANYRYNLIGRYMDGTSVVGYELEDKKTGKTTRVTREQCAFLVGKGIIEGVGARCYKDELIIEATDGYRKLSELPKMDIKTGNIKFKDGAPQGNRRIAVNFDTARLVARVNGGGFVVQTATGYRVVDRDTMSNLLENEKIINASLQKYTKDGKTQKIIRLSTREPLSSLPVYSVEQVAQLR